MKAPHHPPQSPKVSVCTICYKQEAYVGLTIRQIVEQQFDQPFELIIGEDSSPDKTREVCQAWAENHPEVIRLLPEAPNMGMMRNFFRVMNEAQGEYIALCEGDDYWTDPKKLQQQSDYLDAHPECGMVYSPVLHYRERRAKFGPIWGGAPATTFEELLKGNCISTPTVLFRRKLWEEYLAEVEPQKRPWRMGDYPLWLYIAAKSRIDCLEKPMAVYRILEESASHFRTFAQCDTFCLSTLDLRCYFSERYAPHLIPQLHAASLWERLYFALHYKELKVARTLVEELRTKGILATTRRERKLLRKYRLLRLLRWW